MAKARNRVLEGYSEKHHVIPRCLDGDNSKNNIVRLTPEEHYVAHQLLVCIHPGHYGLLYATIRMCAATDKRPIQCNKLYGWIRKEFARALSVRKRGRPMSLEQRAKLSAAHLGKKRTPHSEETKRKMSIASKGRRKSEAHRAALSIARTGKHIKRTESWRINHANAMRRIANSIDRSWMQSEENRIKSRERMKVIWAKRKAGVLPMPIHLAGTEV